MTAGLPSSKASILVADDNEANRLLAQAALEDEGYRVVLAVDGLQALAAYRAENPDCVLLDIRMPGMDGLAVCQEIRASGSETPIIVVTALRDVDTFDRALSAGADDFLTKPVNPAELVVRVQAGLKLLQLRKELREHYELLRGQRDALLRVQLQKERLTSFLVHDLKNPVGTIDLLAQLLLRGKDSTPSVLEKADHIRREAKMLTRMLLNLLDISKGDEGRLVARRDAVDLLALVQGIVSELEPNAQQRQVRLQFEVDEGSFPADEDMLRRLLTNLAENAVRHAPEGSAVRLLARLTADELQLRVVDAGSGVPAELREKIFAPFVQLEGAGGMPPERTGRGLGLTFCKAAVTAHDGRIWVEDAAPGSMFCVILPRLSADSAAD